MEPGDPENQENEEPTTTPLRDLDPPSSSPTPHNRHTRRCLMRLRWQQRRERRDERRLPLDNRGGGINMVENSSLVYMHVKWVNSYNQGPLAQ